MIRIVFGVFAGLGLLSALGVVLARNLVHAALFLVAFFFIVACQFLLLEAEFIAAVQVLIYIGAVAILMMFGIMLTRNIQGDDTTIVPRGWKIPAALVAFGVVAILFIGIGDQKGDGLTASWSDTTERPSILPQDGRDKTPQALAINDMGKAIGVEMMTRYVVPFELAGLLLTAAVVGAIALAKPEDTDAVMPLSNAEEIARSPLSRGIDKGVPAELVASSVADDGSI
ncbi:NADH-quinone oxidoreductase subunit J [Isosphaeraceae bacterium EP7]